VVALFEKVLVLQHCVTESKFVVEKPDLNNIIQPHENQKAMNSGHVIFKTGLKCGDNYIPK